MNVYTSLLTSYLLHTTFKIKLILYLTDTPIILLAFFYYGSFYLLLVNNKLIK